MKLQKLNLNYLTLIISYFFLLKLNTSLLISESLSINYFFLNFFKGFKLLNLIEISIISIPVLFIRNKEFNFGILFSYTLYLLLFVPFVILFLDSNSNIIEIFFQHIDLTTSYISIEKKNFILFTFILTINFCILLFFTSNKKMILKKILNFDEKMFRKILLINFLSFFCFMLFIIIKEYNQLYEINYRSKLSGLMGYFFYWNIICFLPILFLIENKKILKYLILLSYIFAFIIFKIKVLILFFGFLFFKDLIYYRIVKSKDLLKTLLSTLSVFLIFSFLINFFSWFVLELKDPIYFQRTFITQPKNLLIYLDFFTNNETTMLSHIGLISKFTQNDLNIYDLLRNFYKGGSPTSNLYAVEGIASFGIFGVFFSTFLLVSLARILSYLINEEEEKYLYLSLFFQSVYMVDSPFFPNLITYGIGITILLALIRFKKKDGNF
jgi:hypothetical protein